MEEFAASEQRSTWSGILHPFQQGKLSQASECWCVCLLLQDTDLINSDMVQMIEISQHLVDSAPRSKGTY